MRSVDIVLYRTVGVRLALGAGAWSVVSLLHGLLSGVDSRDPATLIAVTTLLTAVACVACLVPATRAIRVDPVATLRAE
jgi:ABC-type lipoprotein release transport system permease subunit